ncbi:hypothetical protein IPM62_04290 [Candidatus Woesebacteria bacterium]|nr:MAG: hypothetical protein IPM62_04290 [Candidatus Woesebacteria bacterium]
MNKNISYKTTYKKSSKLYLMWIFVGMAIIGTVYFTIQVSTSGAKLAELEKQKIALLNENQKLSSDLVRKTSLTAIEGNSKSLGFNKPEKTVYILDKEPVAGIDLSNF